MSSCFCCVVQKMAKPRQAAPDWWFADGLNNDLLSFSGEQVFLSEE